MHSQCYSSGRKVLAAICGSPCCALAVLSARLCCPQLGTNQASLPACRAATATFAGATGSLGVALRRWATCRNLESAASLLCPVRCSIAMISERANYALFLSLVMPACDFPSLKSPPAVASSKTTRHGRQRKDKQREKKHKEREKHQRGKRQANKPTHRSSCEDPYNTDRDLRVKTTGFKRRQPAQQTACRRSTETKPKTLWLEHVFEVASWPKL